MTSQWQPILFCCPPPDLSTYGCWVHHPASSEITSVIEPYWHDDSPFQERKAKWVIGEKGGHVFFGRRGQVGDLMGEDYPAARDSVKRPLAFLLVYSAPVGTPLPRISGFERIEATMREDIERFYSEFSRIYPRMGITSPTPTAFDFSKTQPEAASDPAWDKTASEIEGGKKSTLLVINHQGEVQTKDLTPEPPPRNDDRSSHTPREGPAQKKTADPPEQESERKSGPSSGGPSTGYSATAHRTGGSRSNTAPAFDGGKATILVSLCAIAIGGITTLIYQLRKKKDRQKEHAKGREVERLALLAGKKEHGSHQPGR